MKIAIVGAGYVGTVAGVCFAEVGNEVICADNNAQRVKALNDGDPVIYEPGLKELMQNSQEKKRLRFTTSIREAVASSEIIFITVNTPLDENGNADLTYLKQACLEVGQEMTKYKVIVNKSTVPVGTHKKLREWIASTAIVPFDVANNPEFLREGSAIHDFLNPERIVIGTDQEHVFNKLKSLYLPFLTGDSKILWMDPISAEMSKYACNAFLATRISFMNELAQLCEVLGGDVESIRKAMAFDHRIGGFFLNSGIGYGGSSFSGDLRALITTAEEHQVRLGIVEATAKANELQKRHLIQLVEGHFGKRLKGLNFGIWGLSFKPNTDDIREAPSLFIIKELLKRGAKVKAYDPVANSNAEKVFGDQIGYCDHPDVAAEGADALLIATDWDEFRKADIQVLKKTMKRKVVFDGRNIFSPQLMKHHGFCYYGIGRGKQNKEQTADFLSEVALLPRIATA
jgi:UDPglucose 6-dehydrogenase